MTNNKTKNTKSKSERAVEKPEAREAVDTRVKKKGPEKGQPEKKEAVVVPIKKGDTKSTKDPVQQGHIERFKSNHTEEKPNHTKNKKGSRMFDDVIAPIESLIKEVKSVSASVVPVVVPAIKRITDTVASLFGAGKTTLTEKEIQHYVDMM